MKQNIITFRIGTLGWKSQDAVVDVWNLQDEISKLNEDGWKVKQISNSMGLGTNSYGKMSLNRYVVTVLVEKEE